MVGSRKAFCFLIWNIRNSFRYSIYTGKFTGFIRVHRDTRFRQNATPKLCIRKCTLQARLDGRYFEQELYIRMRTDTPSAERAGYFVS